MVNPDIEMGLNIDDFLCIMQLIYRPFFQSTIFSKPFFSGPLPLSQTPGDNTGRAWMLG